MALPDEQMARMAATRLGPDPAAAAPAAAPAEAPPTNQEKASVAGPQTEGDKSAQDPISYKVNIGGNERNLSPQQIEETFGRYRDLNFKHAQNAPINDVVNKLMEASGGSPEQIAELLTNSVQAFTKNTQFGNNRPKQAGVAAPEQPQPTATQPNLDAEFAAYEDENALSLPPGYREAAGRMNRLEQQMQQGIGMMNEMLSRSQQGAQMGQQAAQAAQGDREAVIRDTISMNLDAAQSAAQLPDEDGQAFMQYAGERGYTVEDFVDKNLASKVVSDFKNAKNTPELARLQEMSKRREAFLGSQKGSPQDGGDGGPKGKAEEMMSRLATKGMNRISTGQMG